MGKKQGKWIIMGKHKPGTCYTAIKKWKKENTPKTAKPVNGLSISATGT